MNQFLDSPQTEVDNLSSPDSWSVYQHDLTQQIQGGQNYHQTSSISFGDSSKIFPNLDQIYAGRCRSTAESSLTRGSTGSHQELSKKERSQAAVFGNGGSENTDSFNEYVAPDSTFETQNSHTLSEVSLDFDSLQMREEASDVLPHYVDGLSPESRQNAARSLPGLVVGRAKKDCKTYFRVKSKKQNLPEYLSYVRDIIESNDFTCYTEGLLEKHLREIRLKDNTYSGVLQMFKSTSPACQKLVLRVTQSLLSEDGQKSFDKWFSESKMKRDTKTALQAKKACLLANFNEKFVERYDF